MKTALKVFGGVYPGVSDHLQPDGAAVTAKNCRLKSGSLQPFRGYSDSTLNAATGTNKALYRYTTLAGATSWLGNDVVTTYARTPIANDTHDRLYYASSEGFFVRDNAATVTDMTVAALPVVVIRQDWLPDTPYNFTNARITIAAVSPTDPADESTMVTAVSNVSVKWGDKTGIAYQVPDNYAHWQAYLGVYSGGSWVYRALDVPWHPAASMTTASIYFAASLAAFVALDAPPTPSFTIELVSFAASAGDVGTGDPTTGIARSFLVTVVNAYGEESAPLEGADPTPVTIYSGGYWTLTYIFPDATKTYRIYASNTGSAGTEYQFYTEVAGNTSGTINLAYSFTAFGEVLATEGWYPAPSGMLGVITTPFGSLAGFTTSSVSGGLGNTVHFSVPYQAHAWPTANTLVFPEAIVALAPLSSHVLVLTVDNAYLVAGNDPANLSVELIDNSYGCQSLRGVVSLDGVVYYPTVQGLAAVSMQGARLATEGIATDVEWLAEFFPSTLFADEYRGDYVAFFDKTLAAGDDRGFVFSPRTKQLVKLGNDATFTALHAYAGGEHLGCVWSARDVYLFDAHATTNLSFTWKSKPLFTPADTPMGALRVYAASYPISSDPDEITVKIYVDDALKHTAYVYSKTPVRLPSACVGRKWQVEITGHVEVYEVQIATSMEELGE